MKGPKDVALTQEKLRLATDAVELADAEGIIIIFITTNVQVIIYTSCPLCAVNGQKKETEAVKLMSVRAGLLDMSQAWETMGNKCILMAQSQKVPAVINNTMQLINNLKMFPEAWFCSACKGSPELRWILIKSFCRNLLS